jgi:uncharacterized membrane protein (UPF0136 family)
MNPPTFHLAAAAVTALYGLISIGGGILGYVRASSTASLIAGCVAGVFLLLCAAGVWRFPFWSLIAAIVIAVLLAGRFASVLLRKGSGEMTALAYQTALVMIIGGIVVIILAVLALLSGSKAP